MTAYAIAMDAPRLWAAEDFVFYGADDKLKVKDVGKMLYGRKHIMFSAVIVMAITGTIYAQQRSVIIVEDYWAKNLMPSLIQAANVELGTEVVLESDYVNLRRFMECQAQIVALRLYPDCNENPWIYGFAAPQIIKTAYLVGQAKVMVIVNTGNTVNRINYDQLRLILGKDGHDAKWTTIEGSGGKINVYGESKKSISRSVLNSTAMRKIIDRSDYNFLAFGDNWQECDDAEAVIKKVRADPNGVGFILYKGTVPTAVKVLSIAKDASDPIKPSDGPYIQPDYPLAEPLVLYLHPSQPAPAKKICEFAVNSKGSAIAEQFGLITPYMQKQAESAERLNETKLGNGEKLVISGITLGSRLLNALEVEYVKAKKVIQLDYETASENPSAVGEFLNGKKDMVLLLGQPGEQVMKYHRAKWEALNKVPVAAATQPTSQPAATTAAGAPSVAAGAPPATPPAGNPPAFQSIFPSVAGASSGTGASSGAGTSSAGAPAAKPLVGIQEYRLAGRALVIIVHPLNKIDSLTQDQIQAVFAAKVRDWKILDGGAGSFSAAPAAAPAVTGAAGGKPAAASGLDIHTFAAEDGDVKLFHDKVMAPQQIAGVKYKKDASSVIGAVAMDTQGIGFVNYAALPADVTKAGVKILPIRLPGMALPQPLPTAKDKTASPPKPVDRLIRPNPWNVLDGSYPISEQLFLYVSPTASATARDFAKFITTPRTCDETFAANGFIAPPPPRPRLATQPAPPPSQKPTTPAKKPSSKKTTTPKSPITAPVPAVYR